MISQLLERIIMEHIDMKHSLDSQLPYMLTVYATLEFFLKLRYRRKNMQHISNLCVLDLEFYLRRKRRQRQVPQSKTKKLAYWQMIKSMSWRCSWKKSGRNWHPNWNTLKKKVTRGETRKLNFKSRLFFELDNLDRHRFRLTFNTE